MRCYHHADAPAIAVCLGCCRALCDACATRHEHYCERGYEPSLGAASIERPCHHHRSEPSRGMCAGCGQPICVQCGGMVDGQLTCPDCRQRVDVEYDLADQHSIPAHRRSRARALAWSVVAGLAFAVALLVVGVVALSGSVNAQASPTGGGSPTDPVQRHYAELAMGDYQTAWQLLSPSFQSQVQFAAWANSYAGTRIEPSGLEVTALSPSSATVVGDVAITSDVAGQTVGRGSWTLSLVDGVWRIDTASFMTSVSMES